MTDRRDLGKLVGLGEDSQLKQDLNAGIASLAKADKSYFRPHLCLNGPEGVVTIEEISRRSAEANTEVLIYPNPILDNDNIWLNIKFWVRVAGFNAPNGTVMLTPRQTAYIVQNLSSESQGIVLAVIKTWYLDEFRRRVEAGLATITKQFESGNLLRVDDFYNRVFDIQRPTAVEVYHTERSIVGDEVAGKFLTGVTFLDHGSDGFQRADEFLQRANEARDRTAGTMLSMVRAFGSDRRGH